MLRSDVRRPSALRLPPSAFTLVEMLVVISIIGILVSLVTAAAMMARKKVKIAMGVHEMNQLDMALKMYRDKFGEYPPDFAGVDGSLGVPAQNVSRRAIIKHLNTAFQRFPIIGINEALKWNHLQTQIKNAWGVDINTLTPATAMMFWLGGQPKWVLREVADADGGIGTPILPSHTAFDPTHPLTGFSGFSANPANPFDTSPSRIPPFYEFDLDRVAPSLTFSTNGYKYWPSGMQGDKTTGAIVYFRSENGTYNIPTSAGLVPKRVDDPGDTTPPAPALQGFVKPAQNVSNSTFVNATSYQLFCSGSDCRYGRPDGDWLQYPSGTNYTYKVVVDGNDVYLGFTFDDITNFSGGTLEDKMP